MDRNEQPDIPGRLKRLRKVAAPADFVTHLQRRIRALGPGNRHTEWLRHPGPIALLLSIGALIVAAYYFLPFSPSTPPSAPGNNAIQMQSGGAIKQLPADSSRADTLAAGRNDVNTSKMP